MSSRIPTAQPRRALTVLALIAALGLMALMAPLSTRASAQAPLIPTASLVAELSDDGTETIVTIALDPGDELVAAFQGAISYDPNYATPSGCDDAADSLGVCNPESPGEIRFGVVHLDGPWTEASDVFEFVFKVTDPTEIGLSIEEAFGDDNQEIELAVGDPISLGASIPEVGGGSITGTIVAYSPSMFGLRLCAENNETGASTCSGVDSRGSYRIDGLPSGTYTVTGDHYLHDFETVTVYDVEVVSPELTQGIDGVVRTVDSAQAVAETIAEKYPELLGSESSAPVGVSSVIGNVTMTDGTPVPAAMVCIEDPAIRQPTCAATRIDGTYLLKGLIGGNYAVTLTDPGGRFADQTGPSFGLNAGSHRYGVDFIVG